MKIFNGKIAILNIENISSNQYNLTIRFTDAYMNYSMNDISIGDYVFANVENENGNEEVAVFTVANIDELSNDILTVEALQHEFMPLNGDGLICNREKIAFLPTSLNGLSQQMIDYARNVDLHNFADEIDEKFTTANQQITSISNRLTAVENNPGSSNPGTGEIQNPFIWRHNENSSYLANSVVTVSNEGTTYSINVPINGVVQTIAFKLDEIGTPESVEGEDDVTAYSITIDFDVNQVFTPQGEGFANACVMPKVEILAVEDNKVMYKDEAYPELINNHTIDFRFVSSIKTDDNSLIVKLTF